MYNGFYQMGYTLGQSIGKAIFGDPQEEARRQGLALQQNRLPPEALSEAAGRLSRQEARLLQLSLILGGLILALTAVARAA